MLKIAGKYQEKRYSQVDILKGFILFLPALIYFLVVANYAVNIPSMDDYDAILAFLNQYHSAKGADKLLLLFSQHGEHRILSSRIIYVLYDSIFQGINFLNFILIGDLQLVLIFIFLIVLIRRAVPQHWFMVSFVAGCCLFDINNWENADFAMAGMQNYGVILLFIGSLLLYTSKRNRLVPVAAIAQAICLYSSGNGIVASFAIVICCIFCKNRTSAITAISVFAITSTFYFMQYDKHLPSGATMDFGKLFQYFITMVSAHIWYDNLTVQITVGIVTLALCGLLVVVNRTLILKREVLPFAIILIFLLGSMAVASLFRYQTEGVAPNSSRYLIYPNFVLAVLFILFVIKTRESSLSRYLYAPIIILVLVGFNMNANHNLGNLEFLNNTLRKTDFFYPNKEHAREVTQRSCELGIYCIDKHR